MLAALLEQTGRIDVGLAAQNERLLQLGDRNAVLGNGQSARFRFRCW